MDRDYQLENTREAVALFTDEGSLQPAIDELLSSGFDRADLSLLATEHALKHTFGDRFKTSAELEDIDDVPRSSYVSPESIGDAQGGIIGGLVYVGAVAAAGLVAVGGAGLTAVITAAVLAGGASGLVGTFLADIIQEIHAAHVAQHLEHGGLVLWVRTWNPEGEERALSILRNHSGHDVHVHGKRTV
jgi:hypothetical protein